jgi:hypothetical protein
MSGTHARLLGPPVVPAFQGEGNSQEFAPNPELEEDVLSFVRGSKPGWSGCVGRSAP